MRARFALIALAALGFWALADLTLKAGPSLGGIGQAGGFLRRAWPLDFPPLGEILTQVGRTMAVVLLATLVSVLLGGALAVAATVGRRFTAGASRVALTAARALPDVVLAVIFIRFFGLGALPAVLAMGLHSAGMVGRLYAAAVEQADRGPQEALRAVGAGRIQTFCTAVLPQVAPSFLSIALYRLDINLRISAILGYVGSTGIGTELAMAFGRLDYQRGMAWAVVLFVLCALTEISSGAIRRHGIPARLCKVVAVGGVLAVGWAIVASGVLEVDLAGNWLETLTLFWPPTTAGAELGTALLTTVQVALAATALGALVAVPLGSVAASNVAPNRFVYFVSRAVVLIVRSIPELVLAVLFLLIAGPGPVAATLALAVGASGLLGKLVADSTEQLPPSPALALRSVGASRLQTFFGATFRQGVPDLVSNLLYQLDSNLRAATLLGIVGGGGIGLYLLQAMRTREYAVVTMILLLLFAVVLSLELLATRLVRRIR
ncbi:PhnE/PtxC family ABC transporter permease [Kribbella antibiotica]|uniref:PhnE/PtxC family ABC transporter permease n=1 Tax=Kribbella antibiotica TaxID=190195 RepID=UPI00192D891A|nr:ABC transporter permease subunit [Kribbella antibiotica]